MITPQRRRWEQATQALDHASDTYRGQQAAVELAEAAHMDKHGVSQEHADTWTPDAMYAPEDCDDDVLLAVLAARPTGADDE